MASMRPPIATASSATACTPKPSSVANLSVSTVASVEARHRSKPRSTRHPGSRGAAETIRDQRQMTGRRLRPARRTPSRPTSSPSHRRRLASVAPCVSSSSRARMTRRLPGPAVSHGRPRGPADADLEAAACRRGGGPSPRRCCRPARGRPASRSRCSSACTVARRSHTISQVLQAVVASRSWPGLGDAGRLPGLAHQRAGHQALAPSRACGRRSAPTWPR